jgi:hypothetical protein
MKRFVLAAALATAALAGGGLTDNVSAEPLAPFATTSVDHLRLDIQYYPYLHGGRRYCWYDGGWHGPGWYWCGYRYRHGFGWGGGVGWLGWGHEGFRGGVYHGGFHGGGFHGGGHGGGGGFHGGGHGGEGRGGGGGRHR